jgi:arsenite methyltransferase
LACVTRVYTVDEARALLASLRPALDEVIAVRADAAELAASVRQGMPSPLGGLPELKAADARLDELLSSIAGHDLQLKGVAPLLLDFPAELDGVPVLLCWLEGDPELSWYHRADLGFLGRRRIPERPPPLPRADQK